MGVRSTSSEEVKFEALYNEEVNFIPIKVVAIRQTTLDKMGIKVGVQIKDGKIKI